MEYGQKRVQRHYEKNKNPTVFFSIRFLGLPDQPLCNLPPSPDDQQLFFDRLEQVMDIIKITLSSDLSVDRLECEAACQRAAGGTARRRNSACGKIGSTPGAPTA